MCRPLVFRVVLAGLALHSIAQRAEAVLVYHPYYQVNVDSLGNDIPGDAANEPSIAVNPYNPNQMAIGWRQFDTISSYFRQAGVAYSTNAGRTWTASVLDPGQYRSDPVLDFDSHGNFYYSSLTTPTASPDWSLKVFKSTDGGASWSSPPELSGGDKQWMAVDRTSGIGSGNIYQHWNVEATSDPGVNFSRSTDGGSSFESAIAGPQPAMKWGTIDVGPDGTLYLAGAELNEDDGHLFSQSTNAQNPAQTPSFAASQTVSLGGTTVFGDPLNPAGILGQVTIATDHSQTSTHGNIYILGSVNPPGSDPADVMFIRSEDGGQNWSTPVRINKDQGDAYQWFGAMSVAPNGRIDVIWNDTRFDVTNEVSQLFYAYSFDAGHTWFGDRAFTNPFDHALGYPQNDKLGDYYDMVSDNMGVNIAFAATFQGGQDVYFTRIQIPEPSALLVWSLLAGLAISSVRWWRPRRS